MTSSGSAGEGPGNGALKGCFGDSFDAQELRFVDGRRVSSSRSPANAARCSASSARGPGGLPPFYDDVAKKLLDE